VNLLLRAQLRFFARAPWSALTALLGVALAVASIVAVHQIGAAVSSSLDAARPPHLAGLSHLLSRPELAAADYFRLRRAWRAGDVPGVEALVPIVEGYRELDGRRTLVLGADWLAYGGASMPGSAAVPSWRLLEGQAVVADRSLGVDPGGVLTIEGVAYEVVAVVDGGLGPALFVDIALAQRLLDRSPDALGFVGVATVDRWATARRLLDAAMPGIAAGLPEPSVPPHPAMADFAVRAVASELPAAAFARAILFNLGALGLLALLVAWFLVHQVALIWVERQRPVFGRLHALGVSQLGLAAGFVAAFALLGLLATITGTGVGWWLARVLIRISAPDVAGDALPGRPDAVVLAKALLSGVGVCVIGGLLAFRRADGAAALTVAARPARSRPALRMLGVAGAALMILVGVTREGSGLFGGFGAILGLSLVMLLVVRPLLDGLRFLHERRSALGRPVGSAGVQPGTARLLLRLGVREAIWRPEVVSVALAALALAVATSMGVGLMVESLRADFARMMDQRLSGDLYVSGPAASVAAAARWLETQAG
jgi:putative ABC transport system permease protein